MTDFCVLIATHGVAAKSIDTDGRKITNYDLAPRGPRNFRYEEHHVDGFEEAVAFLEVLQRETQKFLIRGGPTAYAAEQQAAGQLLYRRKRADEEAPATFKAVDRDWIMLDIDGLVPPPGVCPTSDEALNYAISQLPPEFHDLSMWYQFSSSAHPSQSVIKVHFMALLDRPISDAALKETARAWNEELGSKLIDVALFDPIQVHYVAAPIISDGPDFLGSRRSGVIRGSRDRAHLVLRKSRGDSLRPGLGLSIGGESVEYDDAGKAVDGREGLLLRIRLAVLIEKQQPQTFEKFVQLVWDRFIAKAKLTATEGVSDTTWTPEMVAEKCRSDWAKRDKFTQRKPIEGVPALYPSEPTPLAEAELQARELVEGYFSAPRDMVLKIQAGLGKTRLVIEALAKLPAGKVGYFYAPTHKLLQEVRDRIVAHNPNANVILVQGRNEENCARHELVKEVVAVGGPVARVLCNGGANTEIEFPMALPEIRKTACPHRKICPYWAQFEKPAQIYLFTTEQLKLPQQKTLPKPDYVVVDESFYRTFVECADFTVTDLGDLSSVSGSAGESIGRAIRNALTSQRPLLGELRSAWADYIDRVLRDIEASRLPRDEARRVYLCSIFREPSARVLALDDAELRQVMLRQLPFQIRELANTILAWWKTRFFRQTNPGALDSDLRRIIANLPSKPKAHRVLVELAAELEEAPDREHSLAVVPTPNGFEVRWSPDRSWLAGPTLCIDASADELISKIFKPEAEFHRIDVERNTGRVVQIHDNRMSRSGLDAPQLVDRVQAVFDWCLPQYEKPAVILYKKDEDAGTFELTESSQVGHLGHVRGLNDWEACDAIFVVGGYLPNITVVEREAAVLARIGGIEVNLVGEWSEALQGVRMREGPHQGIRNRVHPDPLANAILRQHQAEEIVQAVDRIRPVRADPPKDIYLLTSVVVDITVDQLVSLNDLAGTELEKLLKRFGGLVPLSALWLTESAGDLFPGEGSVKDWKRRDLKVQTSIVSYRSLPPLIEGTYRLQGQRGRDSEFIVEPAHPMARTVLEFLVGSLAKYDGPPDRPLDLPLIRPLRLPLMTDIYAIKGREFVRQDSGLPKLRDLTHGAILVGGSVEH